MRQPWSGKRMPPMVIDSFEIFVNLIASFIYGMYLGKKQKVDSTVAPADLYINPYLAFWRDRKKKHVMSESEMEIFDSKYIRTQGGSTLC